MMRTLLKGTVFAILFISSVVHAATVEWEGWKFDYSTSNNSSGLVLSDVEYNDKKILGKASMPVMRVQYDNDVCGPYADIMSSGALRSASQGAPNNACDNKAICQRTFSVNGENMLEVGSNWQIGEYQIYQTYYFSEQGYFDARVYSRGLQCQTNHSHHAHWMLDFDIDGQENDQVVLPDGSIPEIEFNARKSDIAFLSIDDAVTNSSVRLVPSADDGVASDFAQWDMAVRAYRSDEVGRWRLGARGEIGRNYMNSQNIKSADSVVWYVSHLPHSANEGASLWHASGPRIEVNSPVVPPAPPEPPPPAPQPSADNLLANGGFESEKAGWYDCGVSANTSTVSGSIHSGSKALSISNGGCLYQEVPASAGSNLQLSCQASRSGNNWTIMELAFLDSNYNSLASKVVQISTGGSYTEHKAVGLAPEQTAFALAVLYSEDNTRFDTCVLETASNMAPNPAPPVTPTPPTTPPSNATNLLANGGFEDNLGSWNTCAANSLVNVSNDAAEGTKSLSVNNGGCLYQEFTVQTGQQYKLECSAKRSGQRYTSMTLAMLSSDYASLASEELPISSTSFNAYTSTVTAPANSRYGTVVVYSEDPGIFDSCEVVLN